MEGASEKNKQILDQKQVELVTIKNNKIACLAIFFNSFWSFGKSLSLRKAWVREDQKMNEKIN